MQVGLPGIVRTAPGQQPEGYDMIYGDISTARGSSLVTWVTQFAERLGLLNKGSANTTAPTASESAAVQPVTSNSLNVTRVGGVTTLIAAAGGAALLIFNVNKAKDPASIVVAAYISTGIIVAAALVTVAIIIVADIRARASIAAAVSPVPSAQAEVKHVVAEAAPALHGGNPPDFTASLNQVYSYVIIDADAANVILTLPSAASSAWRQMKMSREDSNPGRTVAIHPQNQETILEHHTHDLPAANHIHIYSNGENWVKVE